MSVRRLVLTAAAMSLFAALLAALTPSAGEMAGALAAPQRTADAAGPDSLVLAAAGLLAWTVWAWGSLGLALTAASALPGLLGALARLATQVILPAGARRSAAVLLGLGLGVAAPIAGVATTVLAVPAGASTSAGGVPDWPAHPPGGPATAPAPPVTASESPVPVHVAAPGPTAVPDWPDPSAVPTEESHVVVRGDCLWRIAETSLRAVSSTSPTDGEVARAVQAWWTANADVIGPDPDLLLPGQVLHPPSAA